MTVRVRLLTYQRLRLYTIDCNLWMESLTVRSVYSKPLLGCELCTPATTRHVELVGLRSSYLVICCMDIPRTRTKFRERSFAVAGPAAWNALPVSVRAATAVDLFKRTLKTHLFRLSFLSSPVAVRPNFLFLMLSHHFLRMCGNWPTPSGVHCNLVTTHLLVLCWHQTYLYCHPFLSVGTVFYFSLSVFLYYCVFLCPWASSLLLNWMNEWLIRSVQATRDNFWRLLQHGFYRPDDVVVVQLTAWEYWQKHNVALLNKLI